MDIEFMGEVLAKQRRDTINRHTHMPVYACIPTLVLAACLHTRTCTHTKWGGKHFGTSRSSEINTSELCPPCYLILKKNRAGLLKFKVHMNNPGILLKCRF